MNKQDLIAAVKAAEVVEHWSGACSMWIPLDKDRFLFRLRWESRELRYRATFEGSTLRIG
jgi:hypothetical protein